MASDRSADGTAVLEGATDRDDELGRRSVISPPAGPAGAAVVDAQDKGALLIREYKGRPFFEAKWRDLMRAQRKRRLGRAWVERGDDGKWVPRRGRVRGDWLDERRAYARMVEVIAEHETDLLMVTPPQRVAGFNNAADAWLVHVETEKRIKPSTLAGYRSLLAQPSGKRGQRGARIMQDFGGRPLFEISTSEIRNFLSKLDREDISARTVNIHRQVLHSIFEFSRREDTFGLPLNPVAGTTKRPEDGLKPIETFEAHEIAAIAATAAAGLHRERNGYANANYSQETEREWSRINAQDAALFTIAACTGLRLGELCALRWKDVDLTGRVVVVARAMSAGKETSTKSRRPRSVPLADQAIAALESLMARGNFGSRNDFVFCRPDGGPLDRSAVRARFIRAQKKAGVRVRRFHDLRHTFGTLAIRRFDLVSVKEMMGHSKLTTTERYLHARPRPTDAAKLTAIFDDEEGDEPVALAA